MQGVESKAISILLKEAFCELKDEGSENEEYSEIIYPTIFECSDFTL